MNAEGWYSQGQIKVHYYRPDPNPIIRRGAGSTSLCGNFYLAPPCVEVTMLVADSKRLCKTCLRLQQAQIK